MREIVELEAFGEAYCETQAPLAKQYVDEQGNLQRGSNIPAQAQRWKA